MKFVELALSKGAEQKLHAELAALEPRLKVNQLSAVASEHPNLRDVYATVDLPGAGAMLVFVKIATGNIPYYYVELRRLSVCCEAAVIETYGGGQEGVLNSRRWMACCEACEKELPLSWRKAGCKLTFYYSHGGGSYCWNNERDKLLASFELWFQQTDPLIRILQVQSAEESLTALSNFLYRAYEEST